MGQAIEHKKVRKVARKKIAVELVKMLLEIKKWKFSHRLKFAWWLLFGRGEWKGVRG